MQKVWLDKEISRESGFTLVEILVAVAIFALVSVMCYRQINASVKVAERVEQKYLALWAAENKLEEIFISRQWPSLGETTSDYSLADQRWSIRIKVTETNNKDLRKMEVSVYPEEESAGNAILTLVRYMGKN